MWVLKIRLKGIFNQEYGRSIAILRTIQKNSHFIVAFAVAMIVVMLVIPLPAIILDILDLS